MIYGISLPTFLHQSFGLSPAEFFPVIGKGKCVDGGISHHPQSRRVLKSQSDQVSILFFKIKTSLLSSKNNTCTLKAYLTEMADSKVQVLTPIFGCFLASCTLTNTGQCTTYDSNQLNFNSDCTKTEKQLPFSFYWVSETSWQKYGSGQFLFTVEWMVPLASVCTGRQSC